MAFQLLTRFRKTPRMNHETEITIVSGLPRSGTSMMMKMLEAGGLTVLTDNLRSPDENNPKGYYEFERVKKLKEGDQEWVKDAQGKVVKVISALLEYLPSAYHYKVIFMERDMHEILASQKRMLRRLDAEDSSVSDDTMEALFQKHLQKVGSWLDDQRNLEVLYVNYNQMLLDPNEQVEQVIGFLGGRLRAGPMLAVVDRTLYRERQSGS